LPGAASACARVQRRSVRMCGRRRLVLVGLPAELMVVLEQQERAGEAESTERALPGRRCSLVGEHVFVRYEPFRTEAGEQVYVLTAEAPMWLYRAVLGAGELQGRLQPGRMPRPGDRAVGRLVGRGDA